MKVRLFESADMPTLDALCTSQPFYHRLPDVNHHSFISRFAAPNGTNEPAAFGFLRVIGEGYMVLDRNWGTPLERWIALQTVHNAMIADGVSKGIRRCVTWVPHEIEKPYGRRLESLGWERQDRASFVYEVS